MIHITDFIAPLSIQDIKSLKQLYLVAKYTVSLTQASNAQTLHLSTTSLGIAPDIGHLSG